VTLVYFWEFDNEDYKDDNKKRADFIAKKMHNFKKVRRVTHCGCEKYKDCGTKRDKNKDNMSEPNGNFHVVSVAVLTKDEKKEDALKRF